MGDQATDLENPGHGTNCGETVANCGDTLVTVINWGVN